MIPNKVFRNAILCLAVRTGRTNWATKLWYVFVPWNKVLSVFPGLPWIFHMCMFFPVNVASFADIFIYTYALKSDMKMHCKVSKSGTVGGKERKLTFSPNRVSTLRVSYGNCKGRCLIGVLTLVCGILLVNFRIKWLLWHVEVPFDCAGSHKVWS